LGQAEISERDVTRRKGHKRLRTRTRLIQAAIELIRERGMEGATLAAVAARAGMTTGAIYGNFRNREDLFMAVAQVRAAPIVPQMWPGMSFAELLAGLAEATIAAIPERRAAIRGALSFHQYALAHEDLRKRVVAATAQEYERAAAGLEVLFGAGDLPAPADMVVRLLHVLTDGLLLQRFLTPELLPDEAIRAVFAVVGAPHGDGSAQMRREGPNASY